MKLGEGFQINKFWGKSRERSGSNCVEVIWDNLFCLLARSKREHANRDATGLSPGVEMQSAQFSLYFYSHINFFYEFCWHDG